ncbi:MAG: ABC transporter ATP-binding protein [Fuerstiella sp.]
MSDAAPNAFHKVIADRQFFGRALIIATLAAILSSTLLVGIVLVAAGLTRLVLLSSEPGGALNGLAVTPKEFEGFPYDTINRLIQKFPVLHHPSSALTILFGALAIFVLGRFLLRAFVRNRIARHVSIAINRLREHIQRQALRCNPGDLSGLQQKAAAGLFRQTAGQLEESARQWSFRRLTTIADLIALTVILLTVQYRVGIECVVPIVVCWAIARIESGRHVASADLLTEQVERELEKLTEHLNMSRIVAGYGMETLEHDHFSNSLKAYQARYDSLRQRKVRGRGTANIVASAMVALPLFILCRHLIFGELIQLPSAVALGTVCGWLILSLYRLQNIPKLRVTATVAAESINQYLLRVPAVSQVVGARFLEPMSRLLQFNQVSLETENQPDLLLNLDLKIEFGQRVALLSLDPRESEALVSLIPRFTDPSRGQVLIDGQDIRRVTLESLRAEAVIVGGDEPVFNTTVLENITAGQSDVSRQDAIEACKMVHAESFIRQLPKGYETHLGDQGALLEAGQRFRLSLARALARNPALLVIQEPSAPLGAETKAMLDDTYQRICQNRTVIFLPARLSTVKKCGRIVLLHHGRVDVDGRHEDLVRSSELYRHWEYMRFNVFR